LRQEATGGKKERWPKPQGRLNELGRLYDQMG